MLLDGFWESFQQKSKRESMVDVFNGSEKKSPGQCSIELLFDNSSAKIGGEYASFNEVSIKEL